MHDLNKRHLIIDDAVLQDAVNVVHSTRIGLARNTVIAAKPIVIQQISTIVLQENKVDIKALADELPILLHFRGEFPIAVLIVYEQESGGLMFYPYRMEDGRYCLYDMGFDYVAEGKLKVRAINPLMEYIDEIEPKTIEHMEAITSIALSFLQQLQEGTITLEQTTTDFTKVNNKRAGRGAEPIVNDWVIKKDGVIV